MRLNYIDNIDCLEGLKAIPDKSVDLIVTDPPYTSPVKNAYGRDVIHRLSDLSLQEFYFNELRKEFERVLTPNGRLCIFCDTAYFAVLFGTFYHWKNKASLVWDKGRIGMGNPIRLRHELIFYAGIDSFTPNKDTHTHLPSVIQCPPEKGFHPAQKPLKLVEQLVSCLSFPGDVVLDPFMGSGTTAVACLRTSRNYIGFELSPEYHAIAQQRIADTLDEMLEEVEA